MPPDLLYFLILSLLYSGLLLIAYKKAKRLHLNLKITLDLALVLMISGFIGARLFHVLYEQPTMYFEEPLRILMFWQGGFIFFGGFIAAVIAGAIYLRTQEQPFRFWADFYADITALGAGLGRLSCSVAGCCYGKPTSFLGLGIHPTQMYSLAWDTSLAAILFLLARKPAFELGRGKLFGAFLIFHGMGRMLIDPLRADFRGAFLLGASVSFWIALSLVFLGFVLFLSPSATVKKIDSP
ncbi:MAG: prolipoprotein diacylglyceryl transferase [Proteobacteria bacterium]|jgi:phosphatidylglycerol:prolipoprotein diacylglycerol transferase|nr:prolipoprotein diacylglyceryl transferase [Pseudomonadota bacterium]